MREQGDYKIHTMAELREVLGNPNAMTPQKVCDSLDDVMIDFIRRSPFLVIATADAQGNPDASPKGDGPGFVEVESPRSILIPDRRGNKLLFSFENILANPHVGLIFMVPGTGETLRVNGLAEVIADPKILAGLSARGLPALVATRVTIDQCFFHCAKAFIRSQLWDPQTWPAQQKISFGKMLARKIGGGQDVATRIDEAIEQDYKTNL